MKTFLISRFAPPVLSVQLALVPAVFAADATGNWLWVTPGRNNVPDKESVLSLKADGHILTGKISAPGTDGQPADTAISNGKVDGDTISFDVIRQAYGNSTTNTYSAKVSADKLAGTISLTRNGETRSREWEAKNNGARSVAASVPAPKPGYNEQGFKIVNETKYRELSAEDAEKYLAAYPDTVILDLRPPANFAAGHLKGAVSLDVTDEAHYKELLKPLDKKKRYLIHSVSGGFRTVRVFEYFQESGFEYAVAIKGGYGAWVAAGKPVVK